MYNVLKLSDINNNIILDNLFRSDNKYSKKLLLESIAANKKDCLSYNPKTGILRNNSLGVIESFSNALDIPLNPSLEFIIKWLFSGTINNSCDRKLRGFDF